ncbi:GNAT family N-acetyltransferase [Micromonospora sp. NPDC047074]|uniref:GNAT family N-acetyltransferase n=1 Tax=Micromonospora sp. NPDC047074 TaxID=3154339 RepID=UPI003407D494
MRNLASTYRQDVDGFGLVTIRPLDPDTDIDLIHGWVSQERARFWGMRDAGRDRVEEIYRYLDSLTTHHAWLVHRDDTPVALFQTYDPAADPVGEYYEVLPGDHGTHLLIGAPTGIERGFTGTLLNVLFGFVFADPRHQRVIAEPDARNEKAVRRLLRTGFVAGPLIDLPEKQARLLFLDRETFETRRP